MSVPGSQAEAVSRKESVRSQESRKATSRHSQSALPAVRQSSSRSKLTAPPVAGEQPAGTPAPVALEPGGSSPGTPREPGPGTPNSPQPPPAIQVNPASTSLPMQPSPSVSQLAVQRQGSARSAGPLIGELDRSQSRRSTTLHQPSHLQQQQPLEVVPPSPGTNSILAPDPLSASMRSSPRVDGTVRSSGNAGAGASFRVATPIERQPSGAATPSLPSVAAPAAPPMPMANQMQAAADHAVSAAVAELHAALVERDIEVTQLQQRCRAYEAGMSQDSDARVRTANEERERLAVQLREAESRIRSLGEERNREVKTRDKRISDLQSKLAAAEKKTGGGAGRSPPQPAGEDDRAELIQRASAAEAQASAFAVQLSDLDRRYREMGGQVQAARTEAAQAVAVRADLQAKLQQAQEAILNSTAIGYENEVRLHQARCALHLILRELSSPPEDGSAGSPSRMQLSLSPRRLQQVVSGAWGASASPESFGSPLFADSLPRS